MSQTAKYDLKAVQHLCRSADLGNIWFPAPSRSIAKVIEVYGGTDAPKGYEEAMQFILSGIQALSPGDFVERVLQWGAIAADVYGLIFDGRPWYVKFIFENGNLEQISFHSPDKPMKTVLGKTVG